MKDLSIVQEYLLCVLNQKGKLPALSSEIPVCIVAGAISELFAEGCIAIEEKKIHVKSELPQARFYLKSLYDWIKSSKPMTAEKVAGEMSFSNHKMEALLSGVGESLVEAGCAQACKYGLFGNQTGYVPDPSSVDAVIQKLRAEILESGCVSDETAVLAILLKKSGELKKYFSKYEASELKKRLQDFSQNPANQLVNQMVEYIDTLICVVAASAGAV